jgi:hypothetical protein
MDFNKIVNGAYHSAVLSGLVMTNSLLAKKLLKVKPADLGQLDIKNAAMLTTNVYIAIMVKSALIKNGILPPNINIPPTA